MRAPLLSCLQHGIISWLCGRKDAAECTHGVCVCVCGRGWGLAAARQFLALLWVDGTKEPSGQSLQQMGEAAVSQSLFGGA